MNGPLTHHAQDESPLRLLAVTLGIAEIGVGPVHGIDAVGVAGDGHLVARVVPDVGRVAARAADVAELHLLAGGVVAHAEDQALEPVRAGGYLLDVHHAFHLFDQALDPDAPFQTQLLFQLIEHEVNEHHVGGALRLGEHDGVELLAGPGDDFDDVIVAPLGLHVVDAHAAGARGPLEPVERVHDHAAGIGFGAGGDRILEIEEHVIQVESCGLGHHLLGAAGNGELAAPGASGLSCHESFAP